MRQRRKESLILLIIILVLSLGIGYAYLTTTLSINGTSDIDSNTWNVYWDNVVVTSGSVSGDQVTQAPTISNQTTISYHIRLKEPGEYYEFTVDAKNTGSIDAMIGTINSTINNGNTIPTYLKYEVTYSDGIAIEDNHLLAANTTESYRVRIEYRTDIAPGDLPNGPQNLRIRLMTNYIQSTTSAKPVQRPESFENDSWGTIISAVKSGNTSKYNIGDTKEIDLGDLGVHTLRIANKSTPSECNQSGFSQTACGFVVEFADIIDTQSYDLDIADWQISSLRTYVNDTIYNAIPEEIRTSIIDTYVLSGVSREDESPYSYIAETHDYIYILSSLEVMGEPRADLISSSYTRQLEYYSSIPVTSTSYSAAIKNYNNSANSWWLRSACSYAYPRAGSCVLATGFIYNDRTTRISATIGVSPAFRLG